MHRVACAGVLLAFVLAGCGDDPAPEPVLPDVSFERDGHPLTLAADLPPTYSDGERHAWSLEALFGVHERGRGARVQVEQADGTRVDVDRPFAPEGGGVWVLRANRKGDAQLALVDPEAPFPAFHARGGRRGRPGDPGRQIRGVVRLQLILGAAAGTRPAGQEGKEQLMLQLEAIIDGKARKLDEDALAGLNPVEVVGDSGEGARDAWSLRALVRSLAGEGARLTEVRDQGGDALAVSADAWGATDQVPLLRLNRRGRFKFHWASKDMKPTEGESLRDVTTLVITTR